MVSRESRHCLLADCLMRSLILLKYPLQRKKATGSAYLRCVPPPGVNNKKNGGNPRYYFGKYEKGHMEWLGVSKRVIFGKREPSSAYLMAWLIMSMKSGTALVWESIRPSPPCAMEM